MRYMWSVAVASLWLQRLIPPKPRWSKANGVFFMKHEILKGVRRELSRAGIVNFEATTPVWTAVVDMMAPNFPIINNPEKLFGGPMGLALAGHLKKRGIDRVDVFIFDVPRLEEHQFVVVAGAKAGSSGEVDERQAG